MQEKDFRVQEKSTDYQILLWQFCCWMCISIAIPDHLSIANHSSCHHSSGMDLGFQSEPQNIWGQQDWQTWADINGAFSLVNLAHGIPWAILGPTPNFQHFFTLCCPFVSHQLKSFTSDWTWTHVQGLKARQNPLPLNWDQAPSLRI